MTVRAATPADTSQQVPNRLALVLIGLGAVLGVLALTVLHWFHGSVGLVSGAHSTVGDLGDLIDRLVTARRAIGDKQAIRLGLSDYYYDWLAWVLLAAAVIVAVVATLPTSEGKQVRYLGGIIAVLGVVATVWAVEVYRVDLGAVSQHRRRYVDYLPTSATPRFSTFVSHLSVGGWAALVAFVLIGIGAVLGPRHTRT